MLFQQNQTNTWKVWNLTALTQKWLNGTTPNYGVILWATNEDVNAYDLRFYSRENATNKPKLVVTWSNTPKTVYFLKDHLGSVRATVDQSGTVVGYDDYDPWGYALGGRTMATQWTSLQAVAKNKFTGKEWDDEYGVNWGHFTWRPYDPEIARWFIVDPLGQKHPEASPYAYVLNNPMILVDPDGRDIKNATHKRKVVVVGDTKDPEQPAYVVLSPGQRTEGLEGDFDFYRFVDDDTWYKVSKSDLIDVDVTETGEPKVTNLLGKFLKLLPGIHVRKTTPEEAELAKKEEELGKKREEEKQEKRKQEEERKKREEEKRKQDEQRKENERE